MSAVKVVIDNWDPINLLSHAPGDEYDLEITEIELLLKSTKDCNELAIGIFDIFVRFFGNETFNKSYDECIQIAQRILSDE